MTPWRDRVRKALRDPQVLQGIATVASAWMQDHIDENVGRGAGGVTVSHKPLKTLTSRYWTPKGLKVANSYRNGGQPLRNTGKLQRSLSATGKSNGNNVRLTLRGLRYGLYQDRGFKTKGPNFIPMTLKGARQHGTGNDPNTEGLTKGEDYLMAWRGVTVPSRPFILPTRDDLRTFGKSVYLGLKAVLKGS